eukprot:302523-Chlamydomonas_euryale.AAC.1
MGILPVALFCSGHTFFTQRMWKKLGLEVRTRARACMCVRHLCMHVRPAPLHMRRLRNLTVRASCSVASLVCDYSVTSLRMGGSSPPCSVPSNVPFSVPSSVQSSVPSSVPFEVLSSVSSTVLRTG